MNTPLDTFLSDQALATGRDLAANGTPAVVILPAEGGCVWCDCDVLTKERDPRFCAGCPNEAAMAMHIYSAGSDKADWSIPLCHGHKAEAMSFIKAVVAAGGFR